MEILKWNKALINKMPFRISTIKNDRGIMETNFYYCFKSIEEKNNVIVNDYITRMNYKQEVDKEEFYKNNKIN